MGASLDADRYLLDLPEDELIVLDTSDFDDVDLDPVVAAVRARLPR